MRKTEKFIKGITEIIREYGGTKLAGIYENSLYMGQCYNVETQGGTLQVTIAAKPEQKNPDFLTVFCKFKEPAQAAQVLPSDSNARLNSYSGKWNFHYSKKHNVEECIDDFRFALKQIALEKTTPAKSVVVHLQSFRMEVPGGLNPAQEEAVIKAAVKKHKAVLEDWEAEE